MLLALKGGWLSRASAVERTLTTLRFFDRSPQSEHRSNTTGYRGFYYHFIDPETGFRYRQVELSTIDTALLMAGVLFAGNIISPAIRRSRKSANWPNAFTEGLIGSGCSRIKA